MDNIFQKKLLVLCLGLSTVGLSAPPLAKAAHAAYVEYYYEAGFNRTGWKVTRFKDNIRNKYIYYKKSASYKKTSKKIYAYSNGDRYAYTLHWKTN
ncbi:hypothetical protein BFC20_11030 [Brochothrix thermosphacta]|uniref:hypothetical protein n=1 Tax=Brochothrix thermosphacta TaxID=2756 RepID=UPI000E74184A|nr:hypothetical protein [Brochothrix thermosphacta]ANZ98196.1 hypothetical protein BFC20_11030 [Brochothrix thermosphacta]